MNMKRFRSARVAAFIGATGGAAALIGMAAASTGAYFTDVHAGQINGTFGKVAVTVNGVAVPTGDTASGTDSMQIQWNNMLPGTDKTVTYTVTNTGTSRESVWLAFDDSNGEWSAINQLGTYGDAKINSPLVNADYNNLNNNYPQGTPGNPGQVNHCGDPQGAIAYLPAENHVADINPGGQAKFTFSFGYGPCLSDNALQGASAFANPLLYDIIATQPGISPDDSHNGGVYQHPATTNF